jgi:pimeloyl-ACP methyl ester carboxylesterase
VIARLQLALLIGQLLLAIGVAWGLVHLGWPAAIAIGLGVILPIGLHAAVLTIHFTMAWRGRGPRSGDALDAGAWVGSRAWLAAWAREVVDSMRTFSLAQPLLAGRPFRCADPPAQGPARLPVLLVHGYFCNRALWRPMAARLVARGHAVEAVDLEPPFASIDDYAPRIAAAVDALRSRTGAPQVALVCHSMGGLAARAYLRAAGDNAVACVVTLGTPHQGTLHAALGAGLNVRQMRRDSEWLRRLAADEPPERLRRFTVVMSWQDNIVAPHAVQTLPGARTVTFSGLGHVTLAYDRRVSEAVFEALDEAAASGPARADGGSAGVAGTSSARA